MRKDPHVWLASYQGLGMDLRSPVYRALGYWIPGVIHSSDLITAWADYYSRKFGLRDVPSVELYYAHNKWVRELVPEGQLLEYQPSMGWEPLCEFLGKEIPKDEPFPWVNEAAFLRRVIYTAMGLGSVVWLFLFAVLYVVFLQARYFVGWKGK